MERPGSHDVSESRQEVRDEEDHSDDCYLYRFSLGHKVASHQGFLVAMNCEDAFRSMRPEIYLTRHEHWLGLAWRSPFPEPLLSQA